MEEGKQKTSVFKIIGVIVVIVILCVAIVLARKTGEPEDTNTQEPQIRITNIDQFYNNELVKSKTDIRQLDKGYDILKAQDDKCFILGATKYNEDIYDEFMQNYKDKKSSYIRVAYNTIRGDLCLYDILYDNTYNEIIIISDTTRDRFGNSENQEIKFAKFEKIEIYSDDEHTYWIAYNGELGDELFPSEDLFVISQMK